MWQLCPQLASIVKRCLSFPCLACGFHRMLGQRLPSRGYGTGSPLPWPRRRAGGGVLHCWRLTAGAFTYRLLGPRLCACCIHQQSSSSSSSSSRNSSQSMLCHFKWNVLQLGLLLSRICDTNISHLQSIKNIILVFTIVRIILLILFIACSALQDS